MPRRLVVQFPRCLATRHWNHRAGRCKQSDSIEGCGHYDLTPAAMIGAAVKVVPSFDTLGQVNAPLALPWFHDVCDQQLGTEHEVVAVLERTRIAFEVVEERAQYRLGECGGASIQRVQIRHQAIAETNRGADERKRIGM